MNPSFLRLSLFLLCVATVLSSVLAADYNFARYDGKIRGVNIGGLFVLEPFLTPSLFEQFQNQPQQAVDEYTFCQLLGREEASRQLTDHWNTFATEDDFKQLAANGINRVRIPVGFWAFQNDLSLPYIGGGLQLPYLKRIIQWARANGISVHIDLHAARGSQNGWNHSGQSGQQAWDTVENINNTLQVIRAICEFAFRDSDIADAVVGIELLNEPFGMTLRDLQGYYYRAYHIIRTYSKDALIVIHDGYHLADDWQESAFFSIDTRQNLPNITDDAIHVNQSHNLYNTVIDSHVYHIFVQDELYMTYADRLTITCKGDKNGLVDRVNRIGADKGVIVGEFSVVSNDCTKWLNGVGNGARYDGTFWGSLFIGQCTGDYGIDYNTWSSEYKSFLRQFAETQMSAYEQVGQGWFFWNFKTGKTTTAAGVQTAAPAWNYLLGVEQGWMPANVLARDNSC